MTEYRVVFAVATPGSINIKAAKVNLGTQKLWFYDSEDHLIAVYRWDHLIGFDVVGTSADQVFTNALLHERRPLQTPERAAAVEQRGKLIVLLEEALATLRQAKDDISGQWVAIHDEVRQKTRIELLVQRQEARLRDLQAALLDSNSELQKILNYVQAEFKDMGLTTRVSSAPQPVPPLAAAQPEAQGKSKRWFS